MIQKIQVNEATLKINIILKPRSDITGTTHGDLLILFGRACPGTPFQYTCSGRCSTA